MRYQSLEINYHTAPNNKSTALPILQKLISMMVCLLGIAEYISILPLKLGIDIQSQTKISLETQKFNMAARQPFWKWRRWKSVGF